MTEKEAVEPLTAAAPSADASSFPIAQHKSFLQEGSGNSVTGYKKLRFTLTHIPKDEVEHQQNV